MNKTEVNTFISVIKEHRLLDPTELVQLEELESRCTGTGEVAKELLERGSLTRFQTEQLVQGDAKKLILGQYILMEPLGEGGMGMVYKAKHQRMKRIVALKVIRKDMGGGGIALQRFNQEIEAAAKLVHPNVVIAYDANEVDDTLFFVMEYVEGIDLGKLVQRQGKIPVGSTCDYICQAARGLQHAHERGMVHRDIKPSNLLLSYADSVVKILDMGLARLKEDSEDPNRHLTFTGMVMGTPDFISPEQAKDSRSADIRSDLYSLGCTFYFLLAGHVPFVEGSFTEKLLKHSLEEPPPIDQICPELPVRVGQIVKILMQKNPKDRYQTPAELVADLEPFASPEKSAERYRPVKDRNEDLEWAGKLVSQTDVTLQRDVSGRRRTDATEAEPKSVSLSQLSDSRWKTLPPVKLKKKKREDATELEEQPKPAPKRRKPSATVRGLTAVFGGIALALLVAVGWKAATGGFGGHAVVVGPTSPDTANTVKPNGSERPTRPEATATTTTKNVVPETKPQTKKEGPIGPPPTEPPLVGTIIQLPKRDLKSQKEPLRASIAPNALWLAAGWTDSLWRWDVAKSKPGVPADQAILDYPLYAVAAAPDGRVLFGTSEDIIEKGKVPRPVHLLGLWDPASTEKIRVFQGHTKEITCVAFSPQGNRAISGSEDRSVRLWDLRSGKGLLTMTKHESKVMTVGISPNGSFALSGGRDSRLILWDLNTGKDLTTFLGHATFITCLAFSPDGKFALSGGYDKKIILWDLEKYKRVRTYGGHDDVIWSLNFSADGKRFVSAGADQRVRIWRVDGVEYIQEFDEHKSAVLSAAFSEDGNYVVSISTDNTARRWALRKP
jgi:serine/threonine protein kinase